MANPLAADTGFLPRFLMCEPPSAIGTRMQANARHDGIALAGFAKRLRDILDTPLPMDPETRELQRRILGLSPNKPHQKEPNADIILRHCLQMQRRSRPKVCTVGLCELALQAHQLLLFLFALFAEWKAGVYFTILPKRRAHPDCARDRSPNCSIFFCEASNHCLNQVRFGMF